MKKNLLVCRSGGRTSEYMYKRLLKEYSDEYKIVGIFANTGWEHQETLEFVHKNDIDNKKLFDVDPLWVEAVVHGGRTPSTHKIVTYDTASRNMEPFKDVCAKYGVPNKAYPHCTRELKEHPIHDYVKNVLGWSNTGKGKELEIKDPYCNCGKCFKVVTLQPYNTALGMRIDEPRRVKRGDSPQMKVYPLVDWFFDAPDKLDIVDFWEEYEFNLEIPEHLGNCVGCFRKSDRKLALAYRDAPESFINTLEIDFGYVGSNKINGEKSEKARTMYRNYNTCQSLIAYFSTIDESIYSTKDSEEANEGCASSCEPFASDQLDMFD